MNILITGGTGTLGKELVRKMYKRCKRIVIFSRDEFKQHQMKREWPDTNQPGCPMRYFIGDVRDKERIGIALKNIDFVIHAAAMKQVDTAEYNPDEAIKTNIGGTDNIIKACNRAGIKRCVFISTDKAVDPINLYGATKLCAEKLVVDANNYGPCRFSVCRYGNVEGSRGSVFELWKRKQEAGEVLPITHMKMTRFFIKPHEAAAFVADRLNDMQGGEIFVAKMNRFLMASKLAEMFNGQEYKVEQIGIRPGEKLHEILISQHEMCRTYENKDYYIIYPDFHEWQKEMKYHGRLVPDTFTYTSKGE